MRLIDCQRSFSYATILKGSGSNHKKRYVLLADAFTRPFKDQEEADFEKMREVLENAVQQFQTLDVEVIRSTEGVDKLANDLNCMLPDAAASAA